MKLSRVTLQVKASCVGISGDTFSDDKYEIDMGEDGTVCVFPKLASASTLPLFVSKHNVAGWSPIAVDAKKVRDLFLTPTALVPAGSPYELSGPLPEAPPVKTEAKKAAKSA